MRTLRARRATTPAAVASALLTTLAVILLTVITTVATGTELAQASPSATPTGQAPGQEAGQDCVGLVLDSGAGQVASACQPFSARLTGQQLLVDTGHKLTFDKNGFICQIDGVPDTCTSDNTHYWAYFHRAPGAADSAWEYSQKGAADYTVHPGETEGWAYQDNAQRQPEAVPYQTLRQAAATTSPAATDQPVSTGSSTNDSGSNWTVLVVLLLVLVLLGGTAARIIRRRRNG